MEFNVVQFNALTNRSKERRDEGDEQAVAFNVTLCWSCTVKLSSPVRHRSALEFNVVQLRQCDWE